MKGKRNIRKLLTPILLTAIMLIGLLALFVSSAAAQEPLSSIEGSAFTATPEEFDPNAIALLIQDFDPWIGGNSHTALHDLGVPHDVINSQSLSEVDLSKYKFIMYASAQDDNYYLNLMDNLGKISTFVSNGGLLIAHCCDGGWDGTGSWQGFSILPGGVTHLMHWDDWKYVSQFIHILETEHGVVLSDEFQLTDDYLNGWGYSTHGIFTNLLPDTTVVMVSNEGDNGDGPTYIDYDYGNGKVLATMQTVEWGYFSGSQGWVGNRPEFLLNEIRFALKWIAPQQMIKPVKEGYLIQRFDFDEDGGYRGHRGIDIDGDMIDKDVVAPADGTVVYVWNKVTDAAGKWVWIWHGNILTQDGEVKEKISTRYLHLNKINTDDIYPGAKVYQGKTVIGTVGDTGKEWWSGSKKEAHLHFEVWQGGSIDIIKKAIGEKIAKGKDLWKGGYPPYYNLKENGNQLLALNPLIFVDYKDKPGTITISTYDPVDLIIIDPDGLTVSKEINELPLIAQYYELGALDEDGDVACDVITINEWKQGDYLIIVVPEPGAQPTETYTLKVLKDGIIVTIAENVQIANIPTQPYIVRSTETEIISIIPATIDFDPDTLNLKSKGQWVTVYIELPVGHGYDVSQIDLGTIMLNNQIQAEAKPTEIGDYDKDGIPDLMVKFNRAAIQAILEVDDKVTITITGKLIDGRLFEGKDRIKVISEGK